MTCVTFQKHFILAGVVVGAEPILERVDLRACLLIKQHKNGKFFTKSNVNNVEIIYTLKQLFCCYPLLVLSPALVLLQVMADDKQTNSYSSMISYGLEQKI